MKYSDFTIKLLINRLTELFNKKSTPKKTAGLALEAIEVIKQLQKAAALPPNTPLTLDELRALPEKEWVWIECIEPIPYTNGSAYYCKIDAIRPEVMFECGYPGWGTAFRYESYGKTWAAYRRRPGEAAHEAQ